MTEEKEISRKLVSLKGLSPLFSDVLLSQILWVKVQTETVYGATFNEQLVTVVVESRTEEEELSQWTQESEVLAQMTDPNVLSLIAYYVDEDHKYRIMKFGNQMLSRWMEKEAKNAKSEKGVEPTPWPVRLGMLIQIAQGLKYLGSVKSKRIPWCTASDIILREDLTAFVRLPVRSEESVSESVGELKWFPPEVLDENKYKSLTSYLKVYSYCMSLILFCLLTHQKPYKEVGTWDLKQHIESGGKPKIPVDLDLERIPKGYLGLMTACGTLDPEKRPSMQDIIIALERMKESYSRLLS